MVIRPKLLLMDEPLSNLDAKLRVELRDEIRDIQKTIGIAAIYVTHDQEEALAISDRICVMNAGRIEQIGTPQEIYADPADSSSRSFVGTMNILPAKPRASRSGRRTARERVDDPGRSAPNISASSTAKESPDSVTSAGTVEKYTYLGREAHVLVETPAGRLVVQLADPAPTLSMSQGSSVALSFPPCDVLDSTRAAARIRLAGHA